MTTRLVDLMCAEHRTLILRNRIWPAGYKPGDLTACAGCRAAAWTQPSGAVWPFPEFGRTYNEAIHESGHVVVALAHGFIVDYLALESSGRQGSTAHWSGRTTDKARLDSIEMAEVTLAGEAAVRHWLIKENAADTANLVDAAFGGLLDAEDLRALPWAGGEHQALAGADRLVAEHWAAIERVADMLLARGRLAGDEIADLTGLAGCPR